MKGSGVRRGGEGGLSFTGGLWAAGLHPFTPSPGILELPRPPFSKDGDKLVQTIKCNAHRKTPCTLIGIPKLLFLTAVPMGNDGAPCSSRPLFPLSPTALRPFFFPRFSSPSCLPDAGGLSVAGPSPTDYALDTPLLLPLFHSPLFCSLLACRANVASPPSTDFRLANSAHVYLALPRGSVGLTY